MAQADGPWARAKAWAKLSGSPVERDLLRAVAGDGAKAELFEQLAQGGSVLGSVFDELETAGAGRVDLTDPRRRGGGFGAQGLSGHGGHVGSPGPRWLSLGAV
jgi:hypothetical protein